MRLSSMLAIATVPIFLTGTACSNASKIQNEQLEHSLSLMVIDKLQFDLSHGMPCESNKHCQLPLVCTQGLCAIPPSVTGTPTADTPTLSFTTNDTVQEIHVEVAKNDYDRQMGMMNRRTCAPGWGMLFVFKDELRRAFWMHNTYIPLDMVFIRSDGSISNVRENAEPLNDIPRYTSTDRVKYVLELPAGSVKAYGISHKSHFDMTSFNRLQVLE